MNDMSMNIPLLQEILTRLLEEPGFRAAFFADPETILKGFPLNEYDRAYLLEITDLDTMQAWADNLGVVATLRSAPSPSGGSKGLEETAAPDDISFADPAGQLVSTGFASTAQPGDPIAKTMPLPPDTDHYFWLEIGAPVEGSIETSSVPLPDDLPDGALLHVALFPFAGEFAIGAGQDVGVLRLVAGGQAEVDTAVAVPPSLIGQETLMHRLFFPVRTPATAGNHHLRCNIYYRQVLLQSRLVTMRVMTDPAAQETAVLRSDMDYALSSLRNGRQLNALLPNNLSMMINGSDDGSHDFRFFGIDEDELFKNDVNLDGDKLQDLIDMGRRALRVAAWGDDQPFTSQKQYKYAGQPSLDRLKTDLIHLARRGYRFYSALAGDIAGAGGRRKRELSQVLRRPGRIQIATKDDARLVVPSAIIYDYKLDANLADDAYVLCAEFETALENGTSLAETNCFQKSCAHADDLTTICPSGFWGYRHELGLPVSVVPGQDAPVTIASGDTPAITLSICLDDNFVLRDDHLLRMQQWGLGWQVADERQETFDYLKSKDAQLVYFYCHGGEADGVPYLLVGDPHTETGITADNLDAFDIYWEAPRPQPLVFINGCHTTALEPHKALDFVTGFVQTAEAAGVIGTEITIFEAIAVKFAEECLQRFLVERQPIGTAVRHARLAMLQEMNPLGLVYIPYVMPALRLAD